MSGRFVVASPKLLVPGHHGTDSHFGHHHAFQLTECLLSFDLHVKKSWLGSGAGNDDFDA